VGKIAVKILGFFVLKTTRKLGLNERTVLKDLNELIWLVDSSNSVKFDLDNIRDWWGIDMDSIRYNHESEYGANSTLDVGMGKGVFKDDYAVMARGGAFLDLLEGTTGIDSDNLNTTNGIGFRAATAYLQ